MFLTSQMYATISTVAINSISRIVKHVKQNALISKDVLRKPVL